MQNHSFTPPLLLRLSFWLVLFYVALRPLGTGLDLAEPETIFLGIIALLAFMLAMSATIYYTQIMVAPPLWFMIFGGLYALFAGLALYTAQSGYAQNADDLAWNWFFDALIFGATLIIARHDAWRRTIIACLIAALAVTVIFGFYQRFYALDYLRTILLSDGATTLEPMGESFIGRLNSARITGQFAYANATAGFIIMLLPLCVPFFLLAKIKNITRFFFIALLVGGVMTLIFTGSKTAMAVAIIIGLIILAQRFIPPKFRRLAIIILFVSVIALIASKNYWLPSIFPSLMKHFSVRENYWLSALEMIKTRPWCGFGLDNFGVYYGQFKQVNGWETTRAHNVYLQLAVDGGVGLLAAFLAMLVVFWRAQKMPPQNKNDDGDNNKTKRSAIIGALLAFALMYFFFYEQIFSAGLGIEFFFSALYRGEIMGATIHGIVNLLLLPLTWIVTFWLANKYVNVTWTRWINYGILAALLHFLGDFHYYHSAISGIFWLMLGLNLPTVNYQISKRRANILAALWFVIGLAVLVIFLSPQLHANVARVLAEKFSLVMERTNSEIVIQQTNNALRERSQDSSLYVLRARAEYHQRDWSAAIKSLRTANCLNPHAARLKISLAQMLELISPTPNVPNAINEMRDLYRTAIKLNPLSAHVYFVYARFLHQYKINDDEFTLDYLCQRAREIHYFTTDAAAKLTADELRTLSTF